MGCRDYHEDDIDAIIGKCSCFLYDVHDPDSCSMGFVYMHSGYGAGQDPWMYAALVAWVFYLIGYYRFSTGRGCPKTSIGYAIYDEKLWGRAFVGGGLTVTFVVYFVMRFFFAFGNFNVSRNANVSTLGIFMASYYAIVVGLMNCWWTTLVARQKERHNDDSMDHENPGLLRKTALVLGVTFDTSKDRCKKWVRNLFLAAEALLVVSLVVYVITLFLLGIFAGSDRDERWEHFVFIISALVFWIFVTISLLDTMICYIIHRFHGMRWAIAAAGKESTTTIGRDQLRVEVNECNMAWLAMFGIFFTAVYFIILVTGRCPYVTPEKDLYHGGDPAEYIGQDISILAYFLALCKFFANFIYREALFFWKQSGYEDPNARGKSGTHLPGAESHPKYKLFEMIASISASICSLIIAAAIVTVDLNYKLDAGMVGRMLYLLGFFFALAAVGDQDMYFIILDGRQREFIIDRILSAVIVLGVTITYLTAGIFWLTRPKYYMLDSKSVDVDNFEYILLITGVICAILKRLLMFIHINRLDKLHDIEGTNSPKEVNNGDSNESGIKDDPDPDSIKEAGDEEIAETNKKEEKEESDEPEKKNEGESGTTINNGDSDESGIKDDPDPDATKEVGDEEMAETNKEVEKEESDDPEKKNEGESGITITDALTVSYPYLKIFDDFANIVESFFIVWVLASVAWNGLGICLLIGILCWVHRMALLEDWMKKEGETGDRRIGFKRVSIISVALIILFVVYFLLFTQIFYFATSPLEYYKDQVLIGGHRGTWTTGYAENAYESFDYAAASGYHFVEMDYRMTKDQQLIVMHDTTLDRTTNGTGNVFDFDFAWQQENLRLTRIGTDVLVPTEYPYSLDDIMQHCGPNNLDIIMNHEVKQDSNMSAIPLALNAICENNVAKTSFISTGDTRFQHILSKMEPEISLEKDFLVHTSSMAMSVPRNVNMYANSNLLLFFNTWMIPNQHAIGNGVICYFLALESPLFINWFRALGVDIFMLNNPQNCIDAGQCPPKKRMDLPRYIGQKDERK